MPPGRKSNPNCPPDLHLKLPEEVRNLIDNLGSGGYHEKIINILLKEAKQDPVLSSIEIQMKLVELGRKRKELGKQEEKFETLLQSKCTEEEYERITKEIHKSVFPEKYLD